jgi:transposase
MKYHAPPKFKKSETDYILANYKTVSVPDMAKQLGRGAAGVYAWLKTKDLQPYRPPTPPRGRSHPFRVGNRKLEVMLDNYKKGNHARREGGGL